MKRLSINDIFYVKRLKALFKQIKFNNYKIYDNKIDVFDILCYSSGNQQKWLYQLIYPIIIYQLYLSIALSPISCLLFWTPRSCHADILVLPNSISSWSAGYIISSTHIHFYYNIEIHDRSIIRILWFAIITHTVLSNHAWCGQPNYWNQIYWSNIHCYTCSSLSLSLHHSIYDCH